MRLAQVLLVSRYALALTIAAAATTGGQARAGFFFEFADGNGTATTSFVASPGSSVEIQVFLRATGDDLTLLNDQGLFSAGVALTYDDPAGIGRVVSDADIRPNAAFVNLIPAPDASPTAAGFTGDVGFDPFLTPATGADRIFLGSFVLSALADGVVTLHLTDRTPGFDETLLGDGTVLDDRIEVASARFVAASVPEPSGLVTGSLGLIGLAGLAAGRRAVRRMAS